MGHQPYQGHHKEACQGSPKGKGEGDKVAEEVAKEEAAKKEEAANKEEATKKEEMEGGGRGGRGEAGYLDSQMSFTQGTQLDQSQVDTPRF